MRSVRTAVVLGVGLGVGFLGACNKPADSSAGTPAAATGGAAGAGGSSAPTLHGKLTALKPDDVVATIGTQQVRASEVMDRITAQEIKAESEFLGKVTQAREEAVRGFVMDKLLKAEAEKAGAKTMEDWLKSEVEKTVKTPDEAALRTLYARLVPGGDPPFEMVRDQVAQAAQSQDRQKGIQTVVERVMAQNNVKWSIPAPVLPKVDVGVDDDPILGDKDAKVTIIEFSDFECPYCSRVAPMVHDVVEANKGKVRVVFRDYPLTFHKQARPAAHAANCANAQGKFWGFHDQLFKNQQAEGALEDKALKTYARLAGLDGAKFDECLADTARYTAEVDKDMKDGEKAGVEGTPTFFINGRLFTGAPTAEGFQSAIDAALKEGA